jgi:hypothetical protein
MEAGSAAAYSAMLSRGGSGGNLDSRLAAVKEASDKHRESNTRENAEIRRLLSRLVDNAVGVLDE